MDLRTNTSSHMPDDLKQKTISGVSWSFVEQILVRGFNFVIGIILARLLDPADYGLIGMIGIFMAISQIFIDGGFANALIQCKEVTEKDWLHRGSFLFLNEAMLRLAEKYKSILTFVFKPHPRLLTELYNHPNWGKERTDAYYKQWRDLPYTRLESGNYISLFLESDAMIHDCGSFSVEYHYTQNPVLFFTNDLASIKGQLNELGLAAINAHYIGSSIGDIEAFIENVVIKGEDPMKQKRKAVYDQYLVPPNGKTAAENIYDDLVKSLKLENL